MNQQESKAAYNRAYWAKNRDRLIQKNKAYRASNKDIVNAKQRELSKKRYYENHDVEKVRARKWADANPDKVRIIKQNWEQSQSPEERLYKRTRRRCNSNGTTFNLALEDIIIPEICPVLGIKLEPSRGKASDASPSIDRLIPALGYTKANVRVISNRANSLKNNASLEELEKLVSYLKRETNI